MHIIDTNIIIRKHENENRKTIYDEIKASRSQERYNRNLDNLEKLVIQILGVMPNGYVVGDVQRPTITNINIMPRI